MPELHIVRLPQNDRKTVNYLKDQMLSYNADHLPDRLLRSASINLLLRDEQHHIYGGVVGEVAWEALQIYVLWVQEEYRERGYGEQLLTYAETEARKEGCRLVILETTSFHAPEFYFKRNYQQVGKIEDFPKGETLYYLKKEL